MSDEVAPQDFEYSFPEGQEVLEHNYHVEYQWAAAYESFMEDVKENGHLMGALNVDYKQFMACLNSGLFRIIHIETSDEERYFVIKYWCALEQKYKTIDQLDKYDTNWLVNQFEYLWGWN